MEPLSKQNQWCCARVKFPTPESGEEGNIFEKEFYGYSNLIIFLLK